jgi:hypothetical protein
MWNPGGAHVGTLDNHMVSGSAFDVWLLPSRHAMLSSTPLSMVH